MAKIVHNSAAILPEQFALKAKFIFIHFAVAIIVNLCYNYGVIF